MNPQFCRLPLSHARTTVNQDRRVYARVDASAGSVLLPRASCVAFRTPRPRRDVAVPAEAAPAAAAEALVAVGPGKSW